MTEAEQAYEAARALIAEAKADGRDELDFSGDGFRALEALPPEIGGLSKLRVLDCDNAQVTDLAPIAGLTALQTLWLNSTQVADLAPIAGMTKLEYLGLDGTQVADLAPIAGMTKLKTLGLHSTQVADLAPIAGMTKLEDLWLNGTQVTDLAPIAGMTALEYLRLDGTQVADLAPIAGMTGLKSLDIDGCPVVDLRPLRGLRGLAHDLRSFDLGVRFGQSGAAQVDARMAEIAAIEDREERGQALFAYLEDWVPPEEKPAIGAALQGPILSDALADIAEDAAQFHASSLTDSPAKPVDQRHADLVGNLSFICQRMGRVEVQNRLGKDVRENFKDYGAFIGETPINGRILWFLSNGVRAALSDRYADEAMDKFDRSQLSGFLSESDALVQEYYPDAMRGAQFETDTDPQVLSTELPKHLASVKELVESVDAQGIFAPSVSDTLEMLMRRADGARRGYNVADTEEEREAAGKELQRVAVQSTAFSGRIKGRLTQWLHSVGANPTAQGVAAVGGVAGTIVMLVQGASWVVRTLTPIFEAMWKMVGNLPLPF